MNTDLKLVTTFQFQSRRVFLGLPNGIWYNKAERKCRRSVSVFQTILTRKCTKLCLQNDVLCVITLTYSGLIFMCPSPIFVNRSRQ